ncbi:MAG: hypothetical protein OEY89_11935 [Gammaproteobacteria bacterium]|nr:hypothetical protein [Gammaproteobacteria bacterium]
MNKHKRTAIIIAPFLAIGGFILADYFQPPPDKPAVFFTQQGNCDLKQACQLDTDDLQLHLTYSGQMQANKNILVKIQTSVAVENILLALSDENKNSTPSKLTPSNDQKQWQQQYFIGPALDIQSLVLQMVVTYNGVPHFAEIKPHS